MSKSWFAVLGFSAFILAVIWVARSVPPSPQQGHSPSLPCLEGSWEVTSVQRDGEHDPGQFGSRLTFAGDKVTSEPKKVQVTSYGG